MKQYQPTPSEQRFLDRLYSYKEYAKKMKQTPSWIWTKVKMGELQTVRISGKIFVVDK